MEQAVGTDGNSKVRTLIFGPFPGDSLEVSPKADPLLFAESVSSHLPRGSGLRKESGFNTRSPQRSVFFSLLPSSASEPNAHPWWTYASGNRGFFFGGYCSVEKFSSPMHSYYHSVFYFRRKKHIRVLLLSFWRRGLLSKGSPKILIIFFSFQNRNIKI